MSDNLRNEKRLAKLAYKERDFVRAVKLNRALLKAHVEEMTAEEAAAVSLDLGVCLLRVGEINDAAGAFAEAVRLDPTSERAKSLHAEWSGRFPVEAEELGEVPAADPALDVHAQPGASAAQIVYPMSFNAPPGSDPLVPPSFGGVVGVPHAERRPPFAWGLLTPVWCVVAVSLLVMILRSL